MRYIICRLYIYIIHTHYVIKSFIFFIAVWQRMLRQHMNHASKSGMSWSEIDVVAINGVLQII